MAANDVKLLRVHNAQKMADVIETLANMTEDERKTDVEWFENQLKAHDVEFDWPSGRPRKVVYHEMPDDMLNVSIPTPNAIAHGPDIARQLSDGRYPLADGYDIAYLAPRKPAFDQDEEWDSVYRTRLGDYTIGKCM